MRLEGINWLTVAVAAPISVVVTIICEAALLVYLPRKTEPPVMSLLTAEQYELLTKQCVAKGSFSPDQCRQLVYGFGEVPVIDSELK